MPREEIVEKYVFLTAGACGPCRFGMYVTEYRKALRDAGFDGFRVMLFQQTGGLKQATGDEVGLELNPPFFMGLLQGDRRRRRASTRIGYRVRPYEVEPGATDRALETSQEDTSTTRSANKSSVLHGAAGAAGRSFAEVEVDRTRAEAAGVASSASSGR